MYGEIFFCYRATDYINKQLYPNYVFCKSKAIGEMAKHQLQIGKSELCTSDNVPNINMLV